MSEKQTNHLLTTRQVADQRGLSIEFVRRLITSGKLVAIDGALTGSGRPRYLIAESAVEDFIRQYSTTGLGQSAKVRQNLRGQKDSDQPDQFVQKMLGDWDV